MDRFDQNGPILVNLEKTVIIVIFLINGWLVGLVRKTLLLLRCIMQAVVRTPLIEIDIKGDIPAKLLSVLKEEYGEKVELSEDIDEEKVNIVETEWYRKTKAKTTPGDNLKIYREMYGMTQEKLGEILGGIPRQHISNMERGVRSISIKTAQKLSQIFKVSVEKFI